MSLYASIETPGPRLAVCHLSGALDAERREHLRAVFAACTAFPEVHLDLSGVVFLDSAGLGVIVGGIRRVRERGGTVIVFGPSKRIRRVLQTTGFERVVPISDGSVTEVSRPALIAS